jgi:hypothetical protein
MPCNAMHPIQDLFLEVFHMYYNLICIFICTPICTKFYSCKKWVLQLGALGRLWLCLVVLGIKSHCFPRSRL